MARRGKIARGLDIGRSASKMRSKATEALKVVRENGRIKFYEGDTLRYEEDNQFAGQTLYVYLKAKSSTDRSGNSEFDDAVLTA